MSSPEYFPLQNDPEYCVSFPKLAVAMIFRARRTPWLNRLSKFTIMRRSAFVAAVASATVSASVMAGGLGTKT